MSKISRLIVMGATIVTSGCLGLSGLASATPQAHRSQTRVYRANLSQLNNSGDRGNARFELKGNQLTVSLRTYGASPNLPHAQHFHIGGERHECPTVGNDDTDHDGFISSVEGTPSYGPVRISLTTSGDVSAASGLAIDRFPIADAHGMVDYHRTFTLPEGINADDIKNAVVVQHGISELFNDLAKYDGEKRSTLDASLPFEATVPASCGKLTEISHGNRDGNNSQGNNGQDDNDNDSSSGNTGSDSDNSDRENMSDSNSGGNEDHNTTGPGSRSTFELRSDNETTTTTNNNVRVNNNTTQTARSGNVSSNRNTFGGDARTGSARNINNAATMLTIKNNQ